MTNKNESKRDYVSAAIKFTVFSLLLSLICICFGCAAYKLQPVISSIFSGADNAANAASNGISGSAGDNEAGSVKARVRVVIDAGHGGEDGGTVGVNGTTEKTVNLAVAKKLYDTLTAAGVKCVMTRTDDSMLYDKYGDLNNYHGKKKVYDLKNRLRMSEEYSDAVFVSIHMNAFSSPKYSGLQVYYSPNNEASKSLASQLQGAASQYLQTDNKREIKRAGKDIFILDRIKVPAVLIECGFLSNPAECGLLCDGVYQRKLALTLAASILNFSGISSQDM